jgi:DNA-binding transcriptional MerR regulator
MEYRIGDFSLIARLSVKTLRFYHEEGLLEPDRVDSFTGYRYYGEGALERARVISKLRDLEFSLAEIREILATCEDDESIVDRVARKAKEIEDKLERFRRVDEELSRMLQSAKEKSIMDANAGTEVKTIGDIDVVSVRYKGKYAEMGRFFGGLFRAAGRDSAGAPFALYYDEEFKDDDADIEVCIPLKTGTVARRSAEVSDTMKAGGEQSAAYAFRTIPGGSVASTLHRGSYETIGDSYKVLADYLATNKLSGTTPSRELYLKGPGIIFRGNPKNYVTELQIPIKEK